MAQEQVVGLRIQLNGMNTVIQDVETFERLLKEAKEDLKQIPIGSANFQALKKEIKEAERQLGGINDSYAQGKKELEEYKYRTTALTQAFAGATAAISLFGSESESVSEIQKVAQQALTVYVTAQTLAQTELGGATIATTIAMKAEAAAANTSSVALKGLFNLIKANPVGALVTVLGLAITAFYAFSDSAEEAKDAQKDFNDAVVKDSSQTIGKVKTLTSTISDNSLSLKQRKQAIKELRDIAGPYYKDLSDEQMLTRDYTQDVNKLTNALVQQAVAKAYQTRISTTQEEIANNDILIKQAEKKLKQEQETVENIRKRSLTGINDPGKVLAFSEALKRVDAAQTRVNKLNEEDSKLRKKQQVDIDALNTATAQYIDILGTGEKPLKGTTNNVKDLTSALEAQYQTMLNNVQALKDLATTDAQISSELLDRAEQTLLRAQELRKKREDFYKTEYQKFKEQQDELLFSIIPTEEEQKKLADGYAAVFFPLADAFRKGTLKLDGEVEDIYNKFIGKLLADPNLPENIKASIRNLSEQQEDYLKEYFTRLKESVSRFQLVLKEDLFIDLKPEEVQKKLGEVAAVVESVYTDSFILPGDKEKVARQRILELFNFVKKSAADFKTATDDGTKGLNAYYNRIDELGGSLLALGLSFKKTTDESKQVATAVRVAVDEILKIRGELGAFEPIGNNIFGIYSEDQRKKLKLTEEQIAVFSKNITDQIKSNAENLDFFLKSVADNRQKYLLRFGKEGLIKVFSEISTAFDSIEGLTREQLEDLRDTLNTYINDIRTTLGPEYADAWIALIDKINGRLKELPTEAQENLQKTLINISKFLSEFASSVGRLGSLLSEQMSLQMEMLDTNYQNTLNGIVGDTKEANNKRLELEKGYQEEKKKLEKQARLTTLKITLAETIASGAQGVVESIRAARGNPALAAVFAAINAGITAAQVDLILQQIRFVNTLRRGGRLSGGGLAIGPSHENGGIYAGGGSYIEGNEAIVNRQSTIKYGSLLSSINQAEGGRPILVGSAMDTRLIEVLAKQKQEPIRAYVVEQDITKAQNINRKLEQLASF